MKKQFLFLVSAFTFFTVSAQIRLPKLISNGMILQRDVSLKIWGWAHAGEEITLSFLNKKYNTKATDNGNWTIILPKQKAGGPYTMQLKASNEITVTDILIGDVWLCSGQSNMEQAMSGRLKYKYADEIATVNNPFIRHFLIPDKYDFNAPQTDVESGTWKAANPQNIGEFTAVGYFFAKEIYAKYKVPVGIINAALGGSPAEAWISEAALKKFPGYYNELQKFKSSELIKQTEQKDNAATTAWYKQLQDADLGEQQNWKNPLLNDEGWRTINVPGYWADTDAGLYNGIVWYRKEITVPKSMAGKAAKLELGRIIDADSVFVNGVFVGNTTYQYPARRYELNSTVLKEGKNIITIRITNNNGKGGFVLGKRYELTSGRDTVNLSGSWKYKTGAVALTPAPATTFIRWKPGGLYNAMIAPLINYNIKGAVWYQGESNTGYPENYKAIMQTLIEDWRSQWQNNFPFIYVQLPNYMEAKPTPQTNSGWAILRQQQLELLSVPNTAMVTAIDLGEWNDIHPENKKDIGYRIALQARKIAYGEKNLTASGPLYQSMKIEGNKVLISFSNVGTGLTASAVHANFLTGWIGINHFAVADSNGTYHTAKATIINKNTVEVFADDVKNPVAVKYAWADNPENVNLYNSEGLPASPFSTETPNQFGIWKNKKAAVVITYDDALNVHLDNALPLLDSLGLKATFYLTAFADASKNRISEWRAAAAKGHELGNHTLYHPCLGNLAGRDWVKGEQDMSKYTLQRMENEIRMTNVFLEAVDGKKKRTFAYTCGDMKIGDSLFMKGMKNDFVAARGVRNEMHTIDKVDLYNTDCYVVNGETGEQMIEWVKKAEQTGSLLIILFHGVGGEHGINVSLDAHRKLLQYIKQQENKIWVAPMIDVAEYIKTWQQANGN